MTWPSRRGRGLDAAHRLVVPLLTLVLLGTAGCTGVDAAAYCLQVERFQQDAPSTEEWAVGGDALRGRTERWLKASRRLRAEAPDEIVPSIATTAAYFADFLGLLEKHDYDLAAMSQDPAARRLEAREDELTAAQREIHSFNRTHCSRGER